MNPYEVLGVSEGADEETIKKAYKALVKKYHPDKYINNPLADLAAEKMKEINKAYDMLTKKSGSDSYSPGGARTGGGNNYGGYGGGFNTAGMPASFQTVRQLISMRQPDAAIMMLNQLPKTAEWYFLTGLCYNQKGWYAEAVRSVEQAVRMEPANMEYSSMLESLRNRAAGYRTGGGVYNTGSMCTPCDSCGILPCLCCCPCDCNICC